MKIQYYFFMVYFALNLGIGGKHQPSIKGLPLKAIWMWLLNTFADMDNQIPIRNLSPIQGIGFKFPKDLKLYFPKKQKANISMSDVIAFTLFPSVIIVMDILSRG